MKLPPRPQPRRPSLPLGVLLALALVWLQTLGLAHRVAHAPQAAPAFAAIVGHAHAHAHHEHGAAEAHDHHHPHGASHWDALFGHGSAAEDCRLFDQLALADLAPEATAAPALWSGVPGDTTAPAAPRAAPARLAHRARAPPSAA